MFRSKTLLAVLFTASVVFSCKKDDESPSKTALLTAKNWTVLKYEMGGFDVTADFRDDCDADDFTKFSTDGTYVDNVGTVKCDVDEVNGSGTWKFKENETILNLDPSDEDAEDWKLVQLTSTSMKLSHHDDDVDMDLVVTLQGK
jgi:hypothetical protein